MLDGVLSSALDSTPHTTPQKTFPATSAILHAKDSELFSIGGGSNAFSELCRIPASEYILYDSDPHEGEEIDSYDVLSDTPTKRLQV